MVEPPLQAAGHISVACGRGRRRFRSTMNAFLQMMRGSSDNPQVAEKGVGLFVFCLLLIFLGIMFVGALFIWLARRNLRNRALMPLGEHEGLPWGMSVRFPNLWFDSSARWVAIKCTDLQ